MILQSFSKLPKLVYYTIKSFPVVSQKIMHVFDQIKIKLQQLGLWMQDNMESIKQQVALLKSCTLSHSLRKLSIGSPFAQLAELNVRHVSQNLIDRLKSLSQLTSLEMNLGNGIVDEIPLFIDLMKALPGTLDILHFGTLVFPYTDGDKAVIEERLGSVSRHSTNIKELSIGITVFARTSPEMLSSFQEIISYAAESCPLLESLTFYGDVTPSSETHNGD